VIIRQLPTIATPQDAVQVKFMGGKHITAFMIMDGNGQLANQAIFVVVIVIVLTMIQILVLKVYCNTSTYRCQPLPECNSPSDCAPARCCDTITGARDCKMKETILSYGGKSYLCDPPEGIIEAKDEAENSTKIKSLQ